MRRTAAALAVLVTVAAVALAATPAGAIVVHLRNGRALSYQPLRRGTPAGTRAAARLTFDKLFSNLDYNGGPVMASNSNYLIFWRPATYKYEYPTGYKSGIERYFEDLAADSGKTTNVDSVSAQYDDSEGQFASYASSFAGALTDLDAYPISGCSHGGVGRRCLTDAQIQQELVKFVHANSLPTDLTHEYFLVTPQNVESCFEEAGAESECSADSELPAYCAYHGDVPLGGGSYLIYANDPFVTGNEGCDDGNHPNKAASDGAIQGGLSHEHNESITDPLPNTAWTDFGSAEAGEEGDKCVGEFGTPLGVTEGAKYNQEINKDFYWYQEEWSNQGHACLQRLAFAGTEPTASFTSTPAGLSPTFDASASTAAGGVSRYVWQFNDPEDSRTIETAQPLITHTFPGDGTYTVALTVLAADGTSIGTAHAVTVDEAPSDAFTYTPTTPTAGVPVAFSTTAADPDGSITGYSWSFGDGSPASTEAKPAHVFATAGSDTVTLTVTDSSEQESTSSQTIVVAPAASSGGTTTTTSGGGTPPLTITPVAPAPALPTASVSVLGRTLRIDAGGRTALRLLCRGSAARCGGRVLVEVRTPLRGAPRARNQLVVVGQAAYAAGVGKTVTVALRLTLAGRALLALARGRLSALLSVVRSLPLPLATQTEAVRLVRAAPVRRRR